MAENSDPILSQPKSAENVGSTAGGWGKDDAIINIRPITEQDAEVAARLQIEGFKEKAEWAVGKSNIDDFARRWGDGLKRSPQLWPRNFIAEYNNQPAGSLLLKFYSDSSLPEAEFDTAGISCKALCGAMCIEMALGEKVKNATKCYLDTMCVDSNFRGRGIGKLLLDKAEDEARAMGCRTIYLKVTRTNRAKHLYERQGYRVISNNDCCCCFTYCAVGVRYFDIMEKELQ